MKAAEGSVVEVIAGMEICSEEEVHILALFESSDRALELQSIVYDHIAGTNDPDVFGVQVVADENDEVISFEDRLLIGAVDLPLAEILDIVHGLKGIVIASHIDRECFSVVSQLGFIPRGLRFDALEITEHCASAEAHLRYDSNGKAVFVRNSDAHLLTQIGNNTNEYLIETASFDELQKALKKVDGRNVWREN